MRIGKLPDFFKELSEIVGRKNIVTAEKRIGFYSTGIRVGKGKASAVLFPRDLLEFWRLLKICIVYKKIIIIQAANTGLTGGSTPFGSDYDRDVVIINTLNLDKLILLEDDFQVLAFPGTTLYQLEEKLAPLNRGPHSVIGSSCIGASVIGGVCNNSGGNLVNRGPAYTELSLYARLNEDGDLELVNHLDIDLGESPEEILSNLQSNRFDADKVAKSSRLASDKEYQIRVRKIQENTPARFNSDKRRLFESSGCAGKIAVFAVRLDTFPKPKEERVFFIGSNDPNDLSILRQRILSDFDELPDMGEYMHRNYFRAAEKYCKDYFLLIKHLGTSFLPKLLTIKRNIDYFCNNISFLPNNISDRILQFLANLFPRHLPESILSIADKYEHYMLILSSGESIKEVQKLLAESGNIFLDFKYVECSDKDGKDALLHRYVAGSAPARYKLVNSSFSGDLLPLDVALPRNCSSWHEIIPDEIKSQMAYSFEMGHFLCMVFHWDFVVKKGVNKNHIKQQILNILDEHHAKYPAEHNVGHLYKAESDLADFYKSLDPTNTFNAGIGKMSKKKNYN